MSVRILEHTELAPSLLEKLARLDAAIFPEEMNVATFDRRLRNRPGLLILLAEVGGEACGYKIGYEHSPDVFYSFAGGVLESHRRQGIARSLMAHQHECARQRDYRIVRTHTQNRFRSMLLLNIASGFHVVGVTQKLGNSELSVVLERAL